MSRSSFALAVAMLFAATAVVVTGCDDGSSSNNDMMSGQDMTGQDTSSGTVSASECQTRCVDKAVACQAPETQAQGFCANDICASGLTESEISCLEGTDCQTLTAWFLDPDGTSLCGIGGNNNNNGGACDGYPRCEGNSVVTCTEIDGGTSTETSACGMLETCTDGECVADACIETGMTGCNALNNPSNCCDDRETCFSNGNQAGETICCVPGGDPCDSHEQCCNSDNPTTPYQCINGECTIVP